MDPISDLLIRLKNAQAVGHEEVLVPFSKMKWAVANILKSNGYVGEIEKKKKKLKKSEFEFISMVLKYNDGFGAISGAKMISRPSRRMYIKAEEIKPVRSGHGIAIISTPKGIMDSKQAKKEKVGGEIIFEIW